MTTNHPTACAFLWMIAAGSLPACGKPSEPPSKSVAAAKTKPAAQGAATADQVARQTRTEVRCPARLASAPRAGGAPVDDVIGVRPGMGYDEAANAVLCTHDLLVMQTDASRGFNLKTYDQKLRHGDAGRTAVQPLQRQRQPGRRRQPVARLRHGGHGDRRPAAREPGLGAVVAGRRRRSGRRLPARHDDRAGAVASRPTAPRQGNRERGQERGGAEASNRRVKTG